MLTFARSGLAETTASAEVRMYGSGGLADGSCARTLDAASASAKEQAISFISLGGPQQWRSQFHSTGPRKGGGRWLQLGHRFGSYARASQPRSPMWDRRFRRSLEPLPFRERNPVSRSAVAHVATQLLTSPIGSSENR